MSIENAAGVITNRIVALTGNEATRQFIGKTVLQLHKQGRLLYRIEGTKYNLTKEEYEQFLAHRIIIKKQAKAERELERARAKYEQAQANAEKIRQEAQAASFEFSRQESAPSMTTAMEAIKNVQPSSAGAAKILDTFEKNLTDTTFFDAPKPEFSIDEPKSSGFFDKCDSIAGKFDAFFDKIGFRAKNKIVSAVSGEKNSL